MKCNLILKRLISNGRLTTHFSRLSTFFHIMYRLPQKIVYFPSYNIYDTFCHKAHKPVVSSSFTFCLQLMQTLFLSNNPIRASNSASFNNCLLFFSCSFFLIFSLLSSSFQYKVFVSLQAFSSFFPAPFLYIPASASTFPSQ